MLIHGLQELHEKQIIVPGSRMHYPSRENLRMRFEEFLAEEAKGAAWAAVE